MDSFGSEIGRGRLLQEIYKRKLAQALGGNTDAAELVTGDVSTGAGYKEGRSLLNKPMYESLKTIPIEEQIKLIIKNIKNTKENPGQEFYLRDPSNKERCS